MRPLDLLWLVPALPIAGAALNGLICLFWPKAPKATATWIGVGFPGASMLVALAAIWEYLHGVNPDPFERTFWSWTAGELSIPVAFLLDPLSVVMLFIVTFVGFWIHVYSAGYMSHDPGYRRYFAYLNLFMGAMLLLILGNNFLVMFVGWEGVGLCSYLLIGFYYDKKFAADAGKKAFIVNRIGDFGFLIGMFLIFTTFGSLNFITVFAQASTLSAGTPVIMWMTLALFLGATGKSAQIPLFVWLPDAMAGPTPVSALIHAATMVTGGVYMIARCSILFALAPVTMEVVAVIGACTALFAASIGLVQNDIKKVLAYSTVSQLGYMFLALGVGAFAAGIFHVLTHAFFKALLFLGSGAVIHAMHEEQDIRKMGGLKKYLPTTYKTFLVGTIAIAGIPPLAGFFSKDEILWKAFANGDYVLWSMGIVGAGLTAFYMFRLLSLTFEGEKRWDAGKHPHEAPSTMTIPLIVLAGLSIVGGFVGIPASLGGGNAIEHWLEPVFEKANDKMSLKLHGIETIEYVLMGLSVAVALAGIYLARLWYLKKNDGPNRVSSRFAGMYKLLLNKYYVDEAYDAAIVTPIVKGSDKLLWRVVDVGIIDWCVNALASIFGFASKGARRVQTGVAQSYAIVFLAGVIAIIGWMLVK